MSTKSFLVFAVLAMFVFAVYSSTISVSAPKQNSSNTTATTTQSPVDNEVVAHPKGYSIQQLTVGNVVRYYGVYSPVSATQIEAIWVHMHGGGQSMGFIGDRSLAAQELQALAEEHGILIVAPNGTNKETGAFDGESGNRWNDTRIEDDSRAANGPLVEAVDDQAFIKALVSTLIENYSLDNNDVFATGISNGGYMVQDMLRLHPGVFAAGAAALSQVTPLMERVAPLQPKPILLWNTTDDDVVPFAGVDGKVLSTEDSTAWWVAANNAIATGVNERVSSVSPRGCYTTLQRYEGDAPVYRYVTQGGGHQLPGQTYAYPSPRITMMIEQGFGVRCDDIDAYTEIWNFFAVVSGDA